MGRNKGRMLAKKQKGTEYSSDNPGPSVVDYKGPILLRSFHEQVDLQSVTLGESYELASNGSGVINLVMSNDPTSASDWSNFVNAWDEFRLLGFRVEYFPYNRYSKTTTTCGPIVTCLDRVDLTPLSSYATAMAYSSAKKHSVEDPWSRELRMVGIEESAYQSTASPTSVGNQCVKTYADSLSLSTKYGRMFLYFRVQFRGRR